MPSRPKKTLSASDRFPPFDKHDKSIVRVVIETPKGSRNKYAYDPELGAFTLHKVLPDGMVFPYDFGFVPSTRAADGDPIDVLLLMDEPVFAGCIIGCRLIGVIEGLQTEDGKTERNDRLVAVATENHTYSTLDDLADLNKQLITEIGDFFINYNKIQGKKFEVIGTRGPKTAKRLLKKAIKARR